MTDLVALRVNASSGLGKIPQEDQYVFTEAQWSRVIPVPNLSRWQVEGIKRLVGTMSLPADWDSYGGPPPGDSVVSAAIELLMGLDLDYFLPPRVVPVSGGGVQLEWNFGPRELELHVLEDGSVEYLRTEDGNVLDEGTARAVDFPRVRSLLAWLISVPSGRTSTRP
ncbi:MAG: hypothetical protein ACE5JU_21070 [Candidatus Binatia bacterium]